MVFSQNITHSSCTLYLEAILLGLGRQADVWHPAPWARALQAQQNHVSDQLEREEIKAYHHLSVLFIHLMSFEIVHQLPENMTWTNMCLGLNERNSKEKLQFPFQIQSQKVHVLPQIPCWISEMPSFLFKPDFWMAKFNALPALNYFTGWKFIQ